MDPLVKRIRRFLTILLLEYVPGRNLLNTVARAVTEEEPVVPSSTLGKSTMSLAEELADSLLSGLVIESSPLESPLLKHIAIRRCSEIPEDETLFSVCGLFVHMTTTKDWLLLRDVVGDLKSYTKQEGKEAPSDAHILLMLVCAVQGGYVRIRRPCPPLQVGDCVIHPEQLLEDYQIERRVEGASRQALRVVGREQGGWRVRSSAANGAESTRVIDDSCFHPEGDYFLVRKC